MTRRSRIIRNSAVGLLLAVVLAFVVISVCVVVTILFPSKTEGCAANPREAVAVPESIRNLKWVGGIDYVRWDTAQGPEYWITGKTSLEEVRGFCGSRKLEISRAFIDEFTANSLVKRYELDPRKFKLIDDGELWEISGSPNNPGTIFLWFYPDSGRLILHVRDYGVDR